MHIRKLDDCSVTFLVLLGFGIEYFAVFPVSPNPITVGGEAADSSRSYPNSLAPSTPCSTPRKPLSKGGGETLPEGGEGKREDRPALARERAVSRMDGTAVRLDNLLADE